MIHEKLKSTEYARHLGNEQITYLLIGRLIGSADMKIGHIGRISDRPILGPISVV